MVSSACSQVTLWSDTDTLPLTSSPATMFRPLSAARMRRRLTTSASLKSSEISLVGEGAWPLDGAPGVGGAGGGGGGGGLGAGAGPGAGAAWAMRIEAGTALGSGTGGGPGVTAVMASLSGATSDFTGSATRDSLRGH